MLPEHVGFECADAPSTHPLVERFRVGVRIDQERGSAASTRRRDGMGEERPAKATPDQGRLNPNVFELHVRSVFDQRVARDREVICADGDKDRV